MGTNENESHRLMILKKKKKKKFTYKNLSQFGFWKA